MTEQEWLACTDAQRMIGFLIASKAGKRKLRLFACACCRRIWYQFNKSEPSRLAVEVAERYADRQATKVELGAAHAAAVRAYHARSAYGPGQARQAVTYAAAPALEGVYYISGSVSSGVSRSGWSEVDREHAELAAHPKLLRCIFNPFRPGSMKAGWRTKSVLALARAAYEERVLPAGELDPTRLAVLTDALEEAGCESADIMNHLRGPGPHVRGCWTLDLILGKR
jgi:hypothetical protein